MSQPSASAEATPFTTVDGRALTASERAIIQSAASRARPCVRTVRVAIAGCTGVVGQRFISLLTGHPYLRLVALSASERSAGRKYKDACAWRMDTPLPDAIADMVVGPTTVEHFQQNGCQVVFSALDSSVAGDAESALAAAGCRVFSNARNHRMDPLVPILIPHANSEHIQIIKEQKKQMGYGETGGFIVTNANCSSTGLAVVLRPLRDAFGLKRVFVVTLQALSGAGYPGVSALDITDNIVPFIDGEEDKMEIEPQKILGALVGTGETATLTAADFKVAAHCNRVPVLDGHSEVVSLEFERRGVTPEDVIRVLRDWRSEAQTLGLPSAPKEPIYVCEQVNRPQPRLDRDRGGGYVVTVGRVRPCSIFDIKLALCSHNTVLGAAGGSILNAELAYSTGFV